MKVKKRSKQGSKESKKELHDLKIAFKNGTLKFDSKKIAHTILEDKDIRKGLTK